MKPDNYIEKVIERFRKKFGIFENGVFQKDLFIPPTITAGEIESFLTQELKRCREEAREEIRYDLKYIKAAHLYKAGSDRRKGQDLLLYHIDKMLEKDSQTYEEKN